MSREPSPRRRLDPATLSRTPSQEQLIAELQGRLGIQPEAEEPAEAAGPSAQDWLTEGIVITVQPRGKRAGGQLVEKVARRCPGLGLGQSQAPGVQVLLAPVLAGGEIWGGWEFLASCDLGRLAPLLVQSGKAQGKPGEVPPPLWAELAISSSSLSLLSFLQVVFPPGSPIPLRRTISVLASPSVPLLQHRTDAAASSSSPLPSLSTSSPLGPSAYTCGSSGVQSAGEEPHDEGVQGPTLSTPAPHTMRSVGCQTDEDPLFPPMQAGLKGTPPFLLPVRMPEPSPTLHTHTHTHLDTLHPSIHQPQHSNHSPALNLDPGIPLLGRSAALLLSCGFACVHSFLDWSSVLPWAHIEEGSHSRRRPETCLLPSSPQAQCPVRPPH